MSENGCGYSHSGDHRFYPVRPRFYSYDNSTCLPLHPVDSADCPNGEGVGDGLDGKVTSEDGGEQGASSHEEFSTRVRPGPADPSPTDRDHHESTGHSVYRDWCQACVEGRGRAVPHRSKDHAHDATPVLSWDYGFLGSKEHRGAEDQNAETSGQSPVLCMRDRRSQSCFWYIVPHKGTDFPTVNTLVRKILNDLQSLGYDKVCFRSDGERPIRSLLKLVCSAWRGHDVIIETSAEGDHASNGGAECGVGLMKGHTRTVKISLES